MKVCVIFLSQQSVVQLNHSLDCIRCESQVVINSGRFNRSAVLWHMLTWNSHECKLFQSYTRKNIAGLIKEYVSVANLQPCLAGKNCAVIRCTSAFLNHTFNYPPPLQLWLQRCVADSQTIYLLVFVYFTSHGYVSIFSHVYVLHHWFFGFKKIMTKFKKYIIIPSDHSYLFICSQHQKICHHCNILKEAQKQKFAK